jgi:hypothetical protein
VITELRTERLVGVDLGVYDGLERLLVNSFGYVAPAEPAAPAATPPAAVEAPAEATAPAN